ncbi:outer membrane protein [Bradyrhizobium sp. 2TAF24]|uniref:outer membrane protein n=1 Tax=Bradyrhizobium sp. 2TAF24 TaxID=3233011 RepID=UPI003F8E6BB3
MRRWMLAAVVAGMAQGAQAADLPDLSDLPILRGGITDGLSHSAVNWQGAYVGGQVGYSSANMDFSKATSSLTSFLYQNIRYASTVSNWTLLGKSSPTSTSFGGFVGYNAQWDDVVLGIEANYSRLSGLNGSATNSLPSINIPQGCTAPPPATTDICGIQLSGTAAAKVTDVLTLRGRAGWAIDNFMPYMFAGLALGRADITRTATTVETNDYYNSTTGKYVQSDPPLVQSTTQGGGGTFVYGYTAGLGLEAMLIGGVFARAEYEYVKFTNIKDISINISTVRAGVGYKF